MKRILILACIIILISSYTWATGITPVQTNPDKHHITIYSKLQETSLVGIDPNIAWDSNSVVNTQKTYTFSEPASSYGEYQFIIYNPSTVTDLTCKIFAIETDLGEDDRSAYITSFTIPKSQTISGTAINTYSKFIEGIFNGTDCKLIFSNDTALGSGEGFEIFLRLRAVK